MAIFVMLLVIFISQTGADDEQIYFTGSSASTYSLISHMKVDDTPSVVFFPIDVADKFNLARSLEINDPLLKLSQWALSDDGIVTIPMTDYVKMASGLSKGFAMGVRSQGEGTIEASLVYTATKTIKETASSEDTAVAAKHLKAEVFGATTLKVLDTGEQEGQLVLDDHWKAKYQEIRKWLQEKDKNNFHSWIKQSRTPLRDQASTKLGEGAVVTYQTMPNQEIKIGSARLSKRQFRAFLRSIAPGRDFTLAHVDTEGVHSMPPMWVVDEILTPVGYVARK